MLQKFGNGNLIHYDFYNVILLSYIAIFELVKRSPLKFYDITKKAFDLTFAFSRSSSLAFLRQFEITVSFSDEQFNSLMTCKVISLGSLLNAIGDSAVPLIKMAR